MGTVNHTQFVLVMFGVSLKTPFVGWFSLWHIRFSLPAQCMQNDTIVLLGYHSCFEVLGSKDRRLFLGASQFPHYVK